MHHAHVDRVEEEAYGRMEFRPGIQAGDTVDFGVWRRTITQGALDCDCGKGVFCPLVIEERR